MTFIQTISFSTSRMEEMQKLMDSFSEQMRQFADSSTGPISSKVLKDRDRDNTYVVIAEFESFEVAMKNSGRPETDAFAKQMAAMADAPPTFANYDVIHEE